MLVKQAFFYWYVLMVEMAFRMLVGKGPKKSISGNINMHEYNRWPNFRYVAADNTRHISQHLDA